MRLTRLLAPLLALPLALAPAQTLDQPGPQPAPPLGSNTLPPLSLTDARELSARAQTLLEQRMDEGGADNIRLARLMLQSVIDYVTLIEQRRATLSDHQWVYLGREILPTSNTQISFTIRAPAPVESVQALRLESTREVVVVHALRLEGPEGAVWERNQQITLDPAFGRHHIDLWDLSTVTAVSATAEALTWREGRPRVRVSLGQPPRRNHLRLAISHLNAARSALEQEDHEAAIARLAQAHEELSLAVEVIGP